MESYVRLTKYYTRLRRGEGNPQLAVTTKLACLTLLTIVSNVFMRNRTYPLMFIGRVYNNYIYIYIYSWLNIMNFLSIYFFVNPFELPYWSYDIRWELVDKPSIISNFPRTFCPTLGHHRGRVYYKSDVTFVCTLLLCNPNLIELILKPVLNVFSNWCSL